MPRLPVKPEYTPAQERQLGRSGTPLPALPMIRMLGIEAFRPGFWNGQDFDKSFVTQLADNFKKYSTGPKPWYRPYVSVNHEKTPVMGELRFGRITTAKVRPNDHVLLLDAEDIPQGIGEMRNSGMLKEPSIEFVRPKIDPLTGKKTGFVGPDGKVVDGPVIKCLTLLGNDLPAVHGMAELPAAVFCFTGGTTYRFGVSQMQTRDQMIAALQALGIDTSSVTDAIPDEFLSAILTFIQSNNAAPAPEEPAPVVPPPAQMADATAGALSALGMPAPAPAGGATAGRLPTQIQTIEKFALQFPGLVEAITASARTASAGTVKRLDAFDAAQTRQMNALKQQAITSFFAEMNDSGQLTPAMQEAMRPTLMSLDNVAVCKFSVGGKEIAGTPLERQFATIRATFPVIKEFPGRRTPQPALGAPPVVPGQGDKLSPERLAKILGGANNPHGQAAIARLAKK